MFHHELKKKNNRGKREDKSHAIFHKECNELLTEPWIWENVGMVRFNLQTTSLILWAISFPVYKWQALLMKNLRLGEDCSFILSKEKTSNNSQQTITSFSPQTFSLKKVHTITLISQNYNVTTAQWINQLASHLNAIWPWHALTNTSNWLQIRSNSSDRAWYLAIFSDYIHTKQYKFCNILALLLWFFSAIFFVTSYRRKMGANLFWQENLWENSDIFTSISFIQNTVTCFMTKHISWQNTITCFMTKHNHACHIKIKVAPMFPSLWTASFCSNLLESSILSL